MTDLNNLFDNVRQAWWGDDRASIEEARHSFDGLREILAHQIAQAFAIPPQLINPELAAQTTYNFRPITALPEEEQDDKTEPLPPVYGPLADILVEQDTWATNGFYIVYRTPLDTFHLYILHTRCYVANYIEEDLKHFLRQRYNEHLSEDFTKYSQSEYEAMFDVDAPLWRLRENPFNDSY